MREPARTLGHCPGNEPPWEVSVTLGTWEAQEGPRDPTPLPREGSKGCPHGTPLFEESQADPSLPRPSMTPFIRVSMELGDPLSSFVPCGTNDYH